MLSLLPHKLFEKMNRLDFASALKVAKRKASAMEKIKSGARLSDDDLRQLENVGPANFFSNTRFYFGPIALTATLTTNIFNPGTTTGGVNCTSSPFGVLYVLISYVSITNKTGSAATVSLWIGGTGGNVAGTEWLFQAYSVPANSFVDRYPQKRFGQADFLVGGAGTATALSIYGAGEIGIGA